MGKKVQEMLDSANQRVPKVEVNQAMEWMNDGNTVFVDVRSKDAVRDSGLVRGAVHAERGMIEFFADQEHALGKPELKPAKRVVLIVPLEVRQPSQVQPCSIWGMKTFTI